MQIKLDLKIFLFAVIFIFTGQIELYIVFMFFTLIHELGHMLVGILLGLKPQKLSIMPVGFSVTFATKLNKKGKTNNTTKKLVIAIAGPIINIIIAVILYYNQEVEFFIISNETMVYTNLLIALFNMIPIYPLDGGRIAKCILALLYKQKQVYMYIHLISKISICILTIMCSIWILYIQNIALLIALAYLWYLVIKENIYYQNKMRLYEAYEKLGQKE